MPQEYLATLFTDLNTHRAEMSSAEQILLDTLEARSHDGPVLTSKDIAFLQAWQIRLNP